MDERLLFSNCVLNKNKLWYVSVEGYLMYMDIDSGKVSYAEIKNIDTWEKHPVCDQMFVYKESVYWVDQFGKNMHEYNIRLEEFYLYELPETERFDLCYAGIFMYENQLYLFPKKTPKLIIFDMEKKQVITACEMYAELACRKDNKEDILLYNAVRHNNCIYAFLTDTETVVEFDLCNNQYRYLVLPQKIADIRCAVWINNMMHILTLRGNVYVWDMTDHVLREIYICNETKLSFVRLVVTKHKLFLLPSLSEKMMMMDLTGRNISEVDNRPKDMQYREINWAKYWGFDEDERYVFFANRTANYMLWINKESEEVEWKALIPPTFREEYEFCKETKHMHREFYQQMSENILYEREPRMLYLFAAAESENGKVCGEKEQLIGQAIWQTMVQ